MLNRRKLLSLGGIAVGGALAAPTLLNSRPTAGAAEPSHHSGRYMHDMNRRAKGAVDVAYTPFSQPMPVPKTLAPSARLSSLDYYRVNIQQANATILPGVQTPVYTYNGTFPGPTLRVKEGRRAIVAFCNNLTEQTNVHLHGGHIPHSSDGYPTELIEPGDTRHYDYPNNQAGASLWYHDHAHGLSAEHVYRGLQGCYIIDGNDEPALNLPSGAYDVPIMLRDAAFDDQGALVWDLWAPGDRPVLLANGKAQPYFEVAARKYRFRFYNAANLREYTLDLGGRQMIHIGSDGGLLPAPVTRTELALTPGERQEVVVDFSGLPVGSQVVLNDAFGGPVLRFDVVRQAADTSQVPAQLRPMPTLPAATVTRNVSFKLIPGVGFGIDGKLFDHSRVDQTVQLGATEIWKITNEDTDLGINHNFHAHMIQFKVLDRNGGPPLPGESGFKDTVVIGPGETVSVKATFGDYAGRYVYHCHMLEHSELGMMAQMEIVP